MAISIASKHTERSKQAFIKLNNSTNIIFTYRARCAVHTVRAHWHPMCERKKQTFSEEKKTNHKKLRVRKCYKQCIEKSVELYARHFCTINRPSEYKVIDARISFTEISICLIVTGFFRVQQKKMSQRIILDMQCKWNEHSTRQRTRERNEKDLHTPHTE